MEFAEARPTLDLLLAMHEDSSSTQNSYALASCLTSYAHGLAIAAKELQRSNLQIDLTPEGTMKVGNFVLLNSLRRNARSQALGSILACDSEQVDCTAAKMNYFRAEAEEQDSGLALTLYYSASMEAKVQKFLFGKTIKAPHTAPE